MQVVLKNKDFLFLRHLFLSDLEILGCHDRHLWMAKNANFATALGFSPAPILDLSPLCTGVAGYSARYRSRATGAVSAKPSQVSDTSCSSSMVGIGLKKGDNHLTSFDLH